MPIVDKTTKIAYRCPHCGHPQFTRIIIRRAKVRIEGSLVIEEGKSVPTWAGYACDKCKTIVPIKGESKMEEVSKN